MFEDVEKARRSDFYRDAGYVEGAPPALILSFLFFSLLASSGYCRRIERQPAADFFEVHATRTGIDERRGANAAQRTGQQLGLGPEVQIGRGIRTCRRIGSFGWACVCNGELDPGSMQIVEVAEHLVQFIRICRETVSTARRTGSIHRHGCGVGIGRRFWRGRDERWTSPIWPEAGPAQPCGVMRADQAALGSAAFTGAT